MIPAQEALKRLQDGNRRFVSNLQSPFAFQAQSKQIKLVQDQMPLAIILGCSDARVPAEIVFDQGLGDLFVIRVAGNIVAPSQVGSVEFAAESFGIRLVVVMGHSRCGAILATLESMQDPDTKHSRNLSSITDRVRPSIEKLLTTGFKLNDQALIQRAVQANIHTSVDHLRHGSPVLEELIGTNGLLIVGAEYSLETGLVEFFDY